MSRTDLADPIALRLSQEILSDIEAIAAASERTRSWLIVRALKLYLAGEGADCLAIIRAREEAKDGGGHDAAVVIAELDDIVRAKLT